MATTLTDGIGAVPLDHSVLGAALSTLNPMLYLAVFTLVFTVILPNNLPYFPIYLLSGLLAARWIGGYSRQVRDAVRTRQQAAGAGKLRFDFGRGVGFDHFEGGNGVHIGKVFRCDAGQESKMLEGCHSQNLPEKVLATIFTAK